MLSYLLLRFFCLFLCTIYAYVKILNIRGLSIQTKFITCIAAIIISIPLSYVFILYELVFIAFSLLFVYWCFPQTRTYMIASLCMAIGIILTLNSIAIIISYNLMSIDESIYNPIIPYVFNDSIFFSTVLESIIFIALVYNLFRIKRLRNGFTFLKIKQAREIGIIASIILMISRSFWYYIEVGINNEKAFLILLYFSSMSILYSLLVRTWWKYQMQTLYLLKNKDAYIKKQQRELDNLKTSNDKLASIIHADNKRLPALYNSLSDFLSKASQEYPALENKSNSLLQSFMDVIEERELALLPEPLTTGIDSLNILIHYMYSLCVKVGIQFEYHLQSLTPLVTKQISKEDLKVLIADLLENARIATYNCEYKKVLFKCGLHQNTYIIEVSDTGVPLQIETIKHMGLQKTTTHQQDGGSGIGLMSLFTILHTCRASLIIFEEDQDTSIYSKTFSIIFDSKKQFSIQSYRKEALKKQIKRKDIIYI